MEWVVHHIPQPLLSAFLELGCPAARGSWAGLPDLVAKTEDPGLLRVLTRVMLPYSNREMGYGAKPLTLAARYGCADLCELLTQHCISPNQTVSSTSRAPELDTSLLVEAALRGDAKVVAMLLDSGAEVNRRCSGLTSVGRLLQVLKIDSGRRHQRHEVLQLLLSRKSDIYALFLSGERGSLKECDH